MNNFILFAGLLFMFMPGCDIANAQDAQNGSLSIFCTAPAVYGKGREESEIAERVNLKTQYFANCYGRNITSGEAREFKVRFRFVIKPAGNVDSVTIVFDGTKNAGFLECMKGIFMQMQFAKIPLNHGDCAVEQSVIFRVL
ncbi:hypothetical protein JNL27_13005 [bacterium]|nr:hypothetical protein [bacterium]